MSNRLTAPRPTWRGAPMIYIVRKLGLSTNLRLCLDAGNDASYASGQPWLDTSGNGYDFNRGSGSGSDSADPTFNGTAGQRVAGNYFSFDGGDYFTYDTTNETWMQNLHKDNALFTWVLWVYGGTLTSFCGTNGGAATTGTGFHFGTDSTNFLVRVVNSTTPALNITSTIAAPTADSRWHMVAVSVNEATAAGIIHMDGANESFSATYSSPSSGNASQTLQIGARGNAANPTSNGARFAAVMAWEGRALSGGELITLYQAARGRFGV